MASSSIGVHRSFFGRVSCMVFCLFLAAKQVADIFWLWPPRWLKKFQKRSVPPFHASRYDPASAIAAALFSIQEGEYFLGRKLILLHVSALKCRGTYSRMPRRVGVACRPTHQRFTRSGDKAHTFHWCFHVLLELLGYKKPSNVSNHGRNNEIPFEIASSSNVPDATPWVPPEKPPPLTSIELNRSFSLEGMLSRAGSANEVTVTCKFSLLPVSSLLNLPVTDGTGAWYLVNRSDTLQTVSYEIEFPSACLVQHVELKICTPLPFVSNEKSPAVDVQRPIEASDNSTRPSTPTPINDQPSLSEPTAKIDANISTPVGARRPRSGRGERPSLVRPPLESTRKVSITDIQFEKGNKNEENASAQNTQSGKAAQTPFIEFEKYFEIKIRYVEGEEEYEVRCRAIGSTKVEEWFRTLKVISKAIESPTGSRVLHWKFTFWLAV